MQDDKPPPSLDDLEAKLQAARRQQEKRGGGRRGPVQHGGLGLALRMATELVVGVVVGVAIGLGLDSWLGTKPWLLILFLFLGAGAGMLNMYRAARGLGSAVGYRPNKGGDEGKPGETEKDGDSA